MIGFLLLFICLNTQAEPLGLPDSTPPDIAGYPSEDEVSSLPAANSIDIPAVIDRPFDAEEGPYIVVRGFRLLDAEDLPRFGISIQTIQTDILDLIRDKQPERGFSIGELQNVADEVTRYYRSKGLILSTAVLPVQTVEDGIVDIKVFIGRLGRVLVQNNEKYQELVLKKPFRKLIGQPVDQKDIEKVLLTLTDFPGLDVYGIFQPGQKVGEADIVLTVQKEKGYDVMYHVDNHGLEETGRNRLMTVIHWNNPTGFADKFSVTYQQTYNPRRNHYWSLDYQRYLGHFFTLGLGTLKTKFDIGGAFAVNQTSTETEYNVLFLKKSILRSRQENLSTQLSLTRKISETSIGGEQSSETRLTVFGLDLDYDIVDTFHPFRALINFFKSEPSNFGGGLNYLSFRYSRGFNNFLGSMGSSSEQFAGPAEKRTRQRGGSGRLAEGRFTKFNLDYQRLQLITENQSLLFRTEFQWSSDLLTSLERYSVGGPENVRGFPYAQSYFDRAYFFSMEYIFNVPFVTDTLAFGGKTWGEILQLSVFYDFVTARQNDPLDLATDRNTSGSWITFKSIGAGLKFNFPGKIASRLMYVTELGPDIPSDSRSGRIWGDFTYHF